MKYLRIAGAVALIAVLATAPVRAAEPLKPSAKWNVDFGDAHCIAVRSYGSAEAPVTLALKRSPIGEVMQLTVLRASGKQAVDQYPGTMILDDGAPLKVSALGYPAKNRATRMLAINLPLADFQAVRTAKVLRLRTASEIDQSFALSQVEPVAGMLDRCVANLRSAWRIDDPAIENGQPAQPKKSLPSYFESRDYPTVALFGDDSGTVGLVMLIDEKGKIASCMVTESSGYASLDAQSCAILTTRAKFDPAMVDGKAVKSGRTFRIRWKMP